jgi:ABC-type glycerol-3-phosphate transport system permease component
MRRTARFEHALSHLVILAGGVLVMVPFFWMLSTSLKQEWEAFQIPPAWLPEEPLWQNYHDAVFKYFNFFQYGLNTLIITLWVLVGRVLSASLVAFGFARVRFVGRNVLFMLVLSTLMVPHQVTIIPLYILFKEIGWLNTFLPLIVPAWFGGSAFSIFLLRQFIMTVNPELDDAARIDGCGWLGIYARIVMPLIKPALAAVAIFSVLGTWNDFFNPLIFLRSNDLFTLAIGLHFYTNSASAATRPVITHVMAGATLIMVPPLLLFFFAQRFFIQGVVFSGVKG